MADKLMSATIPASTLPNTVSTKPAGGDVHTKTAAKDDKAGDAKDKKTIRAVLHFLKKKNLKETEEAFRKEVNCLEGDEDISLETTPDSEPDITSVLSVFEGEGDPSMYEEYYSSFQSFVEKSLDTYKPELSAVLYPLFVHMYLELVYKGHEIEGQTFFKKFKEGQEDYHEEDIRKLSGVTRREHMQNNEIMSTLRSSKYVIRISRDTFEVLKKYLKNNQQDLLLNLIQQHLHLDVFEGKPRSKQAVESSVGAVTGESTFEANKSKIYFALPAEPDLGVVIEDDNEEDDDKDKPKKKKPKKDSNGSSGKKKQEINPNAPSLTRIPMPELKDRDKVLKVTMLKDSAKKLILGRNTLPSICFYTVLNSHQGLNTVSISEDSSLLSGGFQDSNIKLWSLTPRKLRSIKPSTELSKIDKEAEDVMERIMDDRSAKDYRTLVGHSGPVYSTSFNYDNSFLVSASEDKTVRLWSLYTFTNLICYKGHNYPVWDVQFSRQGPYFASGSYDKTARLWSTDHHQPLRVFSGHVSDVNKVAFHPNCNYLATGSCDRTVRLWDIATGRCERILTGHKGAVHSLAFSPDGQFLASSGIDKRILLWDLSEGCIIAELAGHKDSVYSLNFSRDGNILASGGLDNCIKLWDVQKLCSSDDDDDMETDSDSNSLLIGSYSTKNTPVHQLHFTLRNLLLASGPYLGV